ncbi:MAG: response regulator [bacterium]|nr:response regulator [bacterium]
MAKILIVEDDPDITRLMARQLSLAGHHVFVAIDAYQGINQVRKERPDLVVLDLKMPAGGGISVLRSIRTSLLYNFTPVVVVTALEDQELKKQVTELGVKSYLQKPLENGTLVQAVKDALEN